MKVSMTTFVDFVIARGATRITRVKRAKEQYSQDYSPARDFYRQLREGIIDVHYKNQPLSLLDTIVKQASTRKRELYRECVAGYKRWQAKKTLTSFAVENVVWGQGQLDVSVNPELGLSIGGVAHLVKLYFKKDNPTKQQLEAALHLLAQHPACTNQGAIPAILDIQAGKLKMPTRQIPGISALLAGDAVAFAAMWDQL